MNFKIILTIILTQLMTPVVGQNHSKTFLFVGTYTEGRPDLGIYVYEFNPNSGELRYSSNSENIINPSYLTISPNGHYLYACTDTKLPQEGSVSSFKIDSVNGSISFINKQQSGGENPVYLTVHKNNKYVINGNYTEGNVSVFQTNEDGSLKPYSQVIQYRGSSSNKARQDKAHIHSTVFSPNHDFIFLPDLGSDKIRVCRFDSTNKKPLIPFEENVVNSVP